MASRRTAFNEYASLLLIFYILSISYVSTEQRVFLLLESQSNIVYDDIFSFPNEKSNESCYELIRRHSIHLYFFFLLKIF